MGRCIYMPKGANEAITRGEVDMCIVCMINTSDVSVCKRRVTGGVGGCVCGFKRRAGRWWRVGRREG